MNRSRGVYCVRGGGSTSHRPGVAHVHDNTITVRNATNKIKVRSNKPDRKRGSCAGKSAHTIRYRGGGSRDRPTDVRNPACGIGLSRRSVVEEIISGPPPRFPGERTTPCTNACI